MEGKRRIKRAPTPKKYGDEEDEVTENTSSPFGALKGCSSRSGLSTTKGTSKFQVAGSQTPMLSKTSRTGLKSSRFSNKIPYSSSEYWANVKFLNLTFSSWIQQQISKTPVCDLSPIFTDYNKYLAEIKEKYSSSASASVAASAPSDDGIAGRALAPDNDQKAESTPASLPFKGFRSGSSGSWETDGTERRGLVQTPSKGSSLTLGSSATCRRLIYSSDDTDGEPMDIDISPSPLQMPPESHGPLSCRPTMQPEQQFPLRPPPLALQTPRMGSYATPVFQPATPLRCATIDRPSFSAQQATSSVKATTPTRLVPRQMSNNSSEGLMLKSNFTGYSRRNNPLVYSSDDTDDEPMDVDISLSPLQMPPESHGPLSCRTTMQPEQQFPLRPPPLALQTPRMGSFATPDFQPATPLRCATIDRPSFSAQQATSSVKATTPTRLVPRQMSNNSSEGLMLESNFTGYSRSNNPLGYSSYSRDDGPLDTLIPQSPLQTPPESHGPFSWRTIQQREQLILPRPPPPALSTPRMRSYYTMPDFQPTPLRCATIDRQKVPTLYISAQKYKSSSTATTPTKLVLELMSNNLTEGLMSESTYCGRAYKGHKRIALKDYPPFKEIIAQVETELPGCFRTPEQRNKLRDSVNGRCWRARQKMNY